MRMRRLLALGSLACVPLAARAEAFLDRVDEVLTVSALDDRVRLRLSGTLDLEYFHVDQPPFGLVDATTRDLFNPRLTLFVDAQFGPHVYGFAQARADRGFDPTADAAEVRLDEYALRITPWEDARFNVQVGKFSPVFGSWMARHLSWDNPFVTAPLPYEHATAYSDIEVPLSGRDFAASFPASETYEYNPIVWGPAYSTGASVSGRIRKFEYAVELKNAAPSARPEAWDATDDGFDHPTVSARVGMRPNQNWKIGLAASRGPYLRPEVALTLPRGRDAGDYEQLLLAQDVSFEWHHLQVWAEFYEVRLEIPHVGNADTFAYYLEAKYKFTPAFFGAVRWNQQLFADIPDGAGDRIKWDRDLWRADLALGYRFTPHTQLKLQYSLERESGPRSHSDSVAVQFTLRF